MNNELDAENLTCLNAWIDVKPVNVERYLHAWSLILMNVNWCMSRFYHFGNKSPFDTIQNLYVKCNWVVKNKLNGQDHESYLPPLQ